MKSFEQCISTIFLNIEKRRDVDYLDKSSVRRYNAAADRIYAAFAYIDEHFPERIEHLMQYVDAEKLESVWYFIFGINKMKNATVLQKKYCIDTLRRMYDNPNLDEVARFSIPINIEKLESKL